jgi:hypothetical protein
MTASITITLSDEVLKTLVAARNITVALGTAAGGGRAPAAAPAAARGDSGGRGGADYRAGSLPARLLQWAGGRKKPFSVPEVMKKLKIKRGHASMLIAHVASRGDIRRVGRGAYVAA